MEICERICRISIQGSIQNSPKQVSELSLLTGLASGGLDYVPFQSNLFCESINVIQLLCVDDTLLAKQTLTQLWSKFVAYEQVLRNTSRYNSTDNLKEGKKENYLFSPLGGSLWTEKN